MLKIKQMLAACMGALFVAGSAMAQERADTGEAKVLAEQAAAYVAEVGPEKAFQAFNDKASTRWKKKDLYVFAYNMKGDCVAHGSNDQLVGKNQLELKDPTGKPIVQEMVATAAKGGGSVDYSWAHPQTKKVEGKTSFVVKLANYDGFVGVGAYR